MPADTQLPLAALWAVALPLLLIAITPFAKFAIVGAALRYALGTPKMPPTPVVLGISLVLSIHVMWPVISRIEADYSKRAPAAIDAAALTAASAQPLADFLKANTREQDAALFTRLRQKAAEQSKTTALSGPLADAISIHAPGFVLTELTEAFMSAFLIFIPFLVIDLIVSSILLATGAHMLSPTTVSLPFKLLLFVAMDGWRLIVQGMIAGYHY
ncbi:MAG: EscR/YscR/HrcR family type III secretion system export apparatus protein [Planctomycetes bacterium]|nr:EscR/YscR/HrcR family type III secretion system export apparatus protein [Planctomycetota bacterium]